MDNDAFHSQLFAMERTLVSPVPDPFGMRQPAVHFHHVDGWRRLPPAGQEPFSLKRGTERRETTGAVTRPEALFAHTASLGGLLFKKPILDPLICLFISPYSLLNRYCYNGGTLKYNIKREIKEETILYKHQLFKGPWW